jgi:hypothetical protein
LFVHLHGQIFLNTVPSVDASLVVQVICGAAGRDLDDDFRRSLQVIIR